MTRLGLALGALASATAASFVVGCGGTPGSALPNAAGTDDGGGSVDGGASEGASGGAATDASRDGAASGGGPGLDASSGGADGNGGARHDAGVVSYPPLTFSAIGKPVQIGGQFFFTEGPVWDPAKQVLYFTDINANTIYRLTLPSTFDVLLGSSQNANGLGLDPQGNVIAAGFVSRSIWKLAGTGMQTLAATYQGKKLNSPDDIIARSDGVIYFTDPTFGINGSQGFAAQTQEISTQGVYRLATDGTLHQEDQSTSEPNGVELSPDERTLYVSYTNTGEVFTFAVATDGALSHKTSFATGVPIADSMCVDAGGNLYVATGNFTGGGGIAVFGPTGTRLGTIAMTQIPTNCAFGGADQKTLFITARTSLTGTPTAGNASLSRIDNMPIPGMPGRP